MSSQPEAPITKRPRDKPATALLASFKPAANHAPPGARAVTFAEQIRRDIRGNLDNPKLSAEAVAKLHGIDRRTLSRRLGAEGTTFSQLHSSLRFERARLMLRSTNAPLSAITTALGYSEQSAFSRAFQSWSGTSPKRFRTI